MNNSALKLDNYRNQVLASRETLNAILGREASSLDANEAIFLEDFVTPLTQIEHKLNRKVNNRDFDPTVLLCIDCAIAEGSYQCDIDKAKVLLSDHTQSFFSGLDYTALREFVDSFPKRVNSGTQDVLARFGAGLKSPDIKERLGYQFLKKHFGKMYPHELGVLAAILKEPKRPRGRGNMGAILVQGVNGGDKMCQMAG